MIDLKTLKQLVRLMQENDLTDLEIDGEGDRVKLRRRSGTPEVQYVTAPQQAAPAPAAPAAPAPAAPATSAESAPAAKPGHCISSPMVGTFYSAPSPDAKPFVNVGDRVSADTVVCIIEAMKVFNEIKAETSGTITRMLVNSGEAVEYGEPLFEITPG